MRWTAVVLIGLATAPVESAAQVQTRAPASTITRPQLGLFPSILQEEQDASRVAWLSPAASAIIPGTGQLLKGQDRGLIYLAAEVFLLNRYFSSRTAGNRERDRFLELAFTVARAPFQPTVRDTSFEYFEQVGKFVESGPFDGDPGPGFAPSTDEQTFNGQIWALARQTFFADPDTPPDPESEEYLRALEFYRSRAVGPNFSWSWTDATAERDQFRQSIRESDAAFRRATQQLGLLLVNHLLSSVDAFVSERISGRNRPADIQSRVWKSPGYGQGIVADLWLSFTF